MFLALLVLAQTTWSDVNESNLAQIREFIMPSQKEEAYKEIPWRVEFWPAVQEARRLGRPILFWTMNGHPLGCT